MSFFRKLFNREEPEDAPITLDVDRRRHPAAAAGEGPGRAGRGDAPDHTTDDPGWRSRVNEYSRLAGQAMTERQGTPTREGCLDLVFEVRPVFTGRIPEGMESIGPLQDEVMAAAADLRELLPGEKG